MATTAARCLRAALVVLAALARSSRAYTTTPLGTVDPDEILTPQYPALIEVGIAEDRVIPFSCAVRSVADAIITLITESQRSDPLLFVSMNPRMTPTYGFHEVSSFDQWRDEKNPRLRYVIARGVGPLGGQLAISNVALFGAEELVGRLEIRCEYIIGFDPLFWDHLYSGQVCPVGLDDDGLEVSVCSGYGTCEKGGKCSCDPDHVGPACGSRTEDVYLEADSIFGFNVTSGTYVYFRIFVPVTFPGGYLVVTTSTDAPVVLLISSTGLPSCSAYEVSNFGDWAVGANVSNVKMPIPGAVVSERRATEDVPTSFVPAPDTCNLPGSLNTEPACGTRLYSMCQLSCLTCMECIREPEETNCSQQCATCTTPDCVSTFAQCAGETPCDGPLSVNCSQDCGECFLCADSQDWTCIGRTCDCCEDCLPVSAKCNKLNPTVHTRALYVSIFNHPDYYNDVPLITGLVNLTLQADPSYAQVVQEWDWLHESWDPYFDVGLLASTMTGVYPDQRQFLYEVPVAFGMSSTELQINIFSYRMTLLHFTVDDSLSSFMFQLVDLDNVEDLLMAIMPAPKTLFDYFRAPAAVDNMVTITPDPEQLQSAGGHVWIAIIGNKDTISTVVCGIDENDVRFTGGWQVVTSFASLLAMAAAAMAACVIVGFCCWTGQKLYARWAPSGFPSLGGLASSVSERRAEDRYLHRGGFTDDGI